MFLGTGTLYHIIITGLSTIYLFSLFSIETLPYLFQALFVLDEGLAPLILQLIYSALSGTPPTKEEGSGSAATESGGGSRPHGSGASSRAGRRKDAEEHRKSKEKAKEKETKVTVVGKSIFQYFIVI